VFELESEPWRSLVNPEVKAGKATFVYLGTPGTRVSLVGDFNEWDPFAELMTEERPGRFTATIEVRPGRHYYAFFAGGRKVLDEANSETGVDPDGRQVSSFTVPYAPAD
jgi:1,4-alpha-glucan branching enzyme